MKAKNKKIMFCPKCKSINIRKRLTLFLMFGAPQEWICQECGFKGHIFPEKEIKLQRKK